MKQTATSGADNHPAAQPSAFKYLVGASALFIACCSAFFSVRGLGLLFVGSSFAVMIMASSLEVGKLVAASFLYRYWDTISRPLRFYLTLAVLVLIGITSLGNYGYLARAYERTRSRITVQEQQIAAIEKEITDTQRQIDNSRGQFGKAKEATREDEAKLQERIVQQNAALEPSLARIQERRKTAQDRRDRDTQVQTQKLAERTDAFNKALASSEVAITDLTQRLAALDRAVDAYTKQGGATFFRQDGIRKGQDLRDEQRRERESIASQTAANRARQDQLRAEQTKAVESVDRELAGIREQFSQEIARIDIEEQDLRKAHRETVGQAEQQLAALRTQGLAVATGGDTQIEALHQRNRSRNEEIRHIREQIAATDIGSYRFVARAFDAQADDVVKWLALVLVLVFDPLAVSLAVGFNAALLRDRRRPIGNPAPVTMTDIPLTATPALAGSGHSGNLGSILAILLVGTAAVAAGIYGGKHFLRQHTQVAHSKMIPADSFAVVAVHPADLRQSMPRENLPAWLATVAGKSQADALLALMNGTLDPQADVYAFAKFPTGRNMEKSDRPAMVCGLVARVTDPAAAETALFRFADQFNQKSVPATPAVDTPVRSHVMIEYGKGRYMDPAGGFFTFGIVDHTAILLLEFEGDPKNPAVEGEMQARLMRPDENQAATTDSADQLPARALSKGGAIALWFDADRFFTNIPKNPAAQARYQQLQAYLGFDLVLKIQAAGTNRLRLSADYAYQADRFKDRQQLTATQLLAGLGSADAAGLSGRLMDRCADTLDYDSCIDRLRTVLGGAARKGVEDVLVEKAFVSARDARFVLTARCNPQAGAPLMAALNAW